MSKRWFRVLVILIVLLTLLVALPMVMPYIYGSPYGYGHGGMMGPWMMGGYGIVGAVLGVLFLAVVIGGGVWLVQSLAHGSSGGAALPRSETPVDILKRRYAAGEITKEQFDAMKRDVAE